MKRKVLEYNSIFQKEDEGGYSVWVPTLPGCVSQGETFEEAKANIAEAITAYLESLAKDGEDIPEEDDKNVFIGQVKVGRPIAVA